jgi:hypothetical protein
MKLFDDCHLIAITISEGLAINNILNEFFLLVKKLLLF